MYDFAHVSSTVLAAARQIRLVIFDIRKPVRQLKISDLTFMQLSEMEQFLYVENQ